MSTTEDFLTGIAGMIVVGVPGTSYSPNPATLVANKGIVMKLMPVSPDEIITLNAVAQGDDISMPLGQIMLQVRARGAKNNPLSPDTMLDNIFGVLHGSTNLVFGSMTVVQLNRRIRVPMGMDEASKRWEAIDQYYADVDYPPTALRPIQGSW